MILFLLFLFIAINITAKINTFLKLIPPRKPGRQEPLQSLGLGLGLSDYEHFSFEGEGKVPISQ